MSSRRVTRNAAKAVSGISSPSISSKSKKTGANRQHLPSRSEKNDEPLIIQNGATNPPSKRIKIKHVETTESIFVPADPLASNGSYSTGDIDDATPPPLPVDRPAEPHRTNAPLKTPGGSRVTTYPRENVDSSPSKTSVPRPTTTTGRLLSEGCAHLIKVEPRLKEVIEKNHCRIFAPEGLEEEIDPFRSLSSGIMAQQVSGAAAKSIKNKFVALFNPVPEDGSLQQPPGFPTPTMVAACEVPFLRQAGLSARKAEYIKGLAEKFASGELSAQMLLRASDEEVLEKLTAVRGLGKWSVEMFSCFGLKRMDVFSTGDLGVQRGMAAFMGKDVRKLKGKGGGKWKYMSEQDMLEHSAKFAPYRSLFMWYMWRIEDVNVDAVQN